MHPRPTADAVRPPDPSCLAFIARQAYITIRADTAMTRLVPRLNVSLIALVALVALVAAAPQEHSYTQADIENGARLYQSSCAGCHGPNGEMVPGVDLRSGQF